MTQTNTGGAGTGSTGTGSAGINTASRVRDLLDPADTFTHRHIGPDAGETEAMLDGTDAVSDWAILNAMVNVASGASWVSFHHGGGVGIGFSQHAGQVVIADGTPEARARVERVLTNDPMMGVIRHADAGYADASACARETGVRIPRAEHTQ